MICHSLNANRVYLGSSYRDINDLRTVQLTSGYFGSFIRTG